MSLGAPGAVLALEVDRDRLRALLLAHQERGLGHAERLRDLLRDHGVEGLAGHGLDDLSEPVRVDAVLVAGAGVRDERRLEARLLAGQDVGRSGQRLVADDVVVPEPIRHTGGVGDQVLDRRLRGRRAQPRRVAVEPVEHLQVGPFRAVPLDRRVEVERAALDELQRSDRRHHLGHRHDPEVGVDGDRIAFARDPRPGRPLVDHPVPVGGDRGHVGDRTRRDGALQNPVDGRAHVLGGRHAGPPPRTVGTKGTEEIAVRRRLTHHGHRERLHRPARPAGR